MNKKQSIFAFGTLICAVVILYFALPYNQNNVLTTNGSAKEEVIDFVQSYLLANISYPKTIDEKYASLDTEALSYFLNLKKGVELLHTNQCQAAWEHWDACLNHSLFKHYAAESYFVIGTALGERDSYSSYILLRKALNLTRSNSNTNKALEFRCLSAIIRLLVSQAEDDGLFQQSDIKAKQYSQEAHSLLNNSTFQISEREVSSSIYRIASESLYWLGNDSLANHYIKQLLAQKQSYNRPGLTRAYADILHGIRSFICGEQNESEEHFLRAINHIGDSTSYLNYDLELPYAYLGALYIKQDRYLEAIDFMERSIKTLQSNHYSDIDEPFKLIRPDEMDGKNSTYNIILCYLRLQHFYKEAINNNASGIELTTALELSEYTNRLIKKWFYKAADEETLLRATKLIKKSNSNAIDLIWAHQDKFEHSVDRVYHLKTEASSFYLNYLIELRKKENESETLNKINKLTLELTNTQQSNDFLQSENVKKRLTLLKYKAELWDKKNNSYKPQADNKIVSNIIDNKKAIVKYFMSFNDLYVTYYTSDKSGWKKLERKNYSDIFKHHKRAIKSQSITNEALRNMYKFLIEPLEEELCHIDELTILPDEKMQGIPFELLQNSKGQYLINQYAINYSYLSKFSKKESLSTTNSFLALAPGFISENNYSSQFYTRDIITDNSFITRSSDKSISLTPIPYSIDEVKEIGQLFKQKSLKTTIFTASEATQANLTNHLLSTDIIHIATHGISRAEHQSGLFFTQNNDDGFLSLQELYHLKVNANLIVLSACKSGTGEIIEGEGVMALPRGFFYAGTSNVMASLWKIHDKKTKELMVTFYKHLLQDNVSYSEALRLAKLECIKKGFLPIDWAGFILISNQS